VLDAAHQPDPWVVFLCWQVVKALVMLHHDLGEYELAIDQLEAQLDKHYDLADLTHINMLSDLYMAMVNSSAAERKQMMQHMHCAELPGWVTVSGSGIFKC